ncbi:MAG TPA: hypothetical protein VNL13_06555 [Sulfolobales archaeon]|nr:hypothetical protein [Sulfolobales archaeon]
MDILAIAHIAISLLVLALLIAIFVRTLRAEYFGDERRSVVYSLKSQQISSQFIILARYVRKLIASWEYLLLIITFIAMALVLSYHAEERETISMTLIPISTNLTESVSILYSSSGLNLTSLPEGSIVVEIYLGALDEPTVIEAGQRIFRAFSVIAINCNLEAGNTLESGLRELLNSLCQFRGDRAIYLVMSKPWDNASYDKAVLYYKDKELDVQVEGYGENVLRALRSIPCVSDSISGYANSMRYSGGLVTPGRFTEIFGLNNPNIAIVSNTTSMISIEGLRNTGAEIICSGTQKPREAIMYTIYKHRPFIQQLIDIIITGLAGGMLLIIFNRSVIPRIMPGSEAILISGGTYWISRLLPLVSIAVAELLSILLFVLSYSMLLSLRVDGEPFISPLWLLPISVISLTISIAHMVRVKTSYTAVSTTYIEKAIPVREYSYVVEDLSHQDVARSIARALETSEFFSIMEREVMEKEGVISMRLRLLYRYAIGVGADVSIYISKHNNGSFIDVEVEPWSVDASRGGIIDSVARMILSRISGVIVVDRISRDLGKD